MGETVDSKTGQPRTGHHHEGDPAAGPIHPVTKQHKAYWVLCDSDRAKGFVRPVRRKYVHTTCGTVTMMSKAIAETYAAQPKFYGSTFCVHCKNHFAVAQFTWDGSTEIVGS